MKKYTSLIVLQYIMLAMMFIAIGSSVINQEPTNPSMIVAFAIISITSGITAYYIEGIEDKKKADQPKQNQNTTQN